MSNVYDAAAAAWDHQNPYADQDFEDLCEEEQQMWVATVAAALAVLGTPGKRKRKPKLTWEQVCELREDYRWCGVSQRVLAERYGVSQNTVGEIVRGEIRRVK